MARRPVKTAAEAALIPVEEPVTIDVGQPTPPPPSQEPVKSGLMAVEKTAPAAASPIAPVPPPATEGPDLVRQLEDMRRSEESARRRAAEAEQQRAAAAQEAQQYRAQTAQSQYDAVANALNSAQQQADMAQAQYASALAAGDHAAAATAMRSMSETGARIVALQNGKEELERRAEAARREPPQQQQQPATVEDQLARMPGLMDAEKDWVRRHPDALSNVHNARRLEVAFYDAEKEGIRRGTPEYFEFFDRRLGYLQDGDREGAMESDLREQNAQRSRAVETRYAAPVSRSGGGSIGGGSESDTRVTLSPQQREAARWAGVDEVTYARGLVKMRAMKRDGFIT